ncbi:diguanylate cyclase [Pseudoalteromonas fenneropenaei]|uniref:diguanylate cyclase n=1 Tax=Pseudoalteromonas fenneropenaei TaxID=1737459 RepID=A0ABV7CJU1_9GAMM
MQTTRLHSCHERKSMYNHSHLTQRLRRISSEEVDVSGPYASFLSDIIHEGCSTLKVTRVSVWLFDNITSPTQLVNVANTDWPPGSCPGCAQCDDIKLRDCLHLSHFPSLNYSDFPKYFQAISSGTSIAAECAASDPRTFEFNHSYLQPHGITTMLDAVIFKNGIPHGVVCCEGKTGVRQWSGAEISYAELIADCCSRRLLVKELWLLQQQLRELAFKDALTGLRNRRYLMDFARREISRHLRAQFPLCVMMIDIDHFKQVNDLYGHDVGDVVLKNFAERCEKALRLEDCLCRLGGEEFIALLPQTPLQDALLVAERLRAKIAESAVYHGALKITLTASFGVHEVNLHAPFSTALKLADDAVYQAKADGRNRVVVG